MVGLGLCIRMGLVKVFFFVSNVSGHSGSSSLPVCHIHPGLSSQGVTYYSRCQHRYGGMFLRVFGG